MTLSQLIEKDYIAAYKAKEQLTLDVLRLLKTAAKNKMVELKCSDLSDEQMMDVLIAQGKQRQDSIAQFNAAGREDLASREAAEFKILQTFLPQALSPEEVTQAINNAINETSAQSQKDFGKVMNFIMAKYKGRVDGKSISATIRERLSS